MSASAYMDTGSGPVEFSAHDIPAHDGVAVLQIKIGHDFARRISVHFEGPDSGLPRAICEAVERHRAEQKDAAEMERDVAMEPAQ